LRSVLLGLAGEPVLAQLAVGKTTRIVVPFPPGVSADVIAQHERYARAVRDLNIKGE
jgi:tripartite-type tricarboxylate transporter receptor subunit TctC